MKKNIILPFFLVLMTQFVLAGPCDPGVGDTLDHCTNEPINLFTVLGGDPDLSGQWYDFNNDPIDEQIEAGELELPGSYDFTYVISSAGCQNDTAFVRLIVNHCNLGLEKHALQGVSLYPNPVVNDLTVSNETGENITMNVFNISGKLIEQHQITLSVSSINLSSINPGTYLVTLTDESGRERHFKILKE